MTVIAHSVGRWQAAAPEPVGPPETLLGRLRLRADGGPVAFGIDCPIGLPRAYVARHLEPAGNFTAFLKALPPGAPFFDVAATIADVSAARPFYPARGLAGMTRLSHAHALGLANADALCRVCDRATAHRPAGAPLFWTLGANQSGKAAIAAWRTLIGPALHAPEPLRLWPFDGAFRTLLAPGAVVMAETYPADAMAQLGIRRAGSKRRQADRIAYAPALRASLARLGAVATPRAGRCTRLRLWRRSGRRGPDRLALRRPLRAEHRHRPARRYNARQPLDLRLGRLGPRPGTALNQRLRHGIGCLLENPYFLAKERPSFLKKRSKKLLSVLASAFPDGLSPNG